MTNQASKLNSRLNTALRLVILGIGGVFIVGIIAYNGSLSVRTDFNKLRDHVEELQTANADLKNDLYALVDAKTLTSVALRLGLVAEKNPEYLNVREGVILAQRN